MSVVVLLTRDDKNNGLERTKILDAVTILIGLIAVSDQAYGRRKCMSTSVTSGPHTCFHAKPGVFKVS